MQMVRSRSAQAASQIAAAAPAGVDLSLHDPDLAAHLLRDLHRLLHGEGRVASRHRYAVHAQQLFALVFVDPHGGPGLKARWL